MRRIGPHLGATLASTGRGPRVACGLAACTMLAAFAWPVDGGPAPAPRRAAAPVQAPDETALQRPLFDPGRRPWTARGPRDILDGDPPRPVLTVRGILLDGAVARALIDDGSGTQAWLARGEGRGDWRVTAVGRDQVTLIQGERHYVATFLGDPATLRPVGAKPVAEAGPALRR
ncbi:hypothetical protein [Methylobacterium frigidaeris]|uniref:General secretion pathway protein GspN n=1 Tax=Methylobacterium frigidaeris TaxID=2038277 RepID=A0AA37H8D7_9HYPH|nr:hypothetical protein [Methylobacterium frigidaeris]PIK72010.1 hypothetical protein CS379_16310 [Methylobacterium frigidaeris]GJD60630.1 hypothetical protein MPEAHAMD_0769 [Methylobacterium frigidaeris]